MILRLLTIFLVYGSILQGARPISLYEDPVVRVRAKVPVVALHTNAPAFPLFQEPTPRWVSVLSVPEAVKTTLNHGPDTQILLIDKQVNVDNETTYYHIAKRVLSQAGVQNHALVELTFDPAYQQLTLHTLNLRRRNNCLDRAGTNDVHLMQAIGSDDPLTHTRLWSLVTLLEDVREGDIIEYSYSVKGQNPSRANRVVDECVFRYPYPVERIYYRVIGDRSRHVHSKAHNTSLEPIRHDLGDGDWELVWNAVSVPASFSENRQPPWYQDGVWIQISEFDNWADVSRWGNNLFAPPKQLPPQLQLLTRQWQEQYESDEARALAALRFVQDDIACIKEDTQQLNLPSDLGAILDNKAACNVDKAYLLTTLLHFMGIEAVPAAVSTSYREAVSQWAPSPAPFDRIIVRLKLDDNIFWLDPTATCQGGGIDQGGCAVYRRALLLDGHSRELTCLGCVSDQPDISSTTSYYLWPDRLESSILVETLVSGETANRLRRDLQKDGPSIIKEILWSNYVKMHGEVSQVSPIDLQDCREENIIVINEHYHAKNMWQLSDQGRKKTFAIYPIHIMARLPTVPNNMRKTPLALEYPTYIVETIHVVTPGQEWNRENTTQQILTQAMDCTISRRSHSDTLTLECQMRVTSDHVPPEDLQKLRQAVLQTRRALAVEKDLPTSYHKQWDITFPFIVNAYLLLIIGFLAIDTKKKD